MSRQIRLLRKSTDHFNNTRLRWFVTRRHKLSGLIFSSTMRRATPEEIDLWQQLVSLREKNARLHAHIRTADALKFNAEQNLHELQRECQSSWALWACQASKSAPTTLRVAQFLGFFESQIRRAAASIRFWWLRRKTRIRKPDEFTHDGGPC